MVLILSAYVMNTRPRYYIIVRLTLRDSLNNKLNNNIKRDHFEISVIIKYSKLCQRRYYYY